MILTFPGTPLTPSPKPITLNDSLDFKRERSQKHIHLKLVNGVTQDTIINIYNTAAAGSESLINNTKKKLKLIIF